MGTIPPNAKRVFKGEIFEVWEWQQKMFDGSEETFEMLRRPDTIQILATRGDKILTTREEQPDLPRRDFGLYGGRAEEGEEPLETAKRELLEESGLATDQWELWKVYEPVAKIEWKIYFFIARNCRKVAEPRLDAGEKIECVEMSFEKFVEKVISEKFWTPHFAADLLRLKLAGRLDEFRIKLFPI